MPWLTELFRTLFRLMEGFLSVQSSSAALQLTVPRSQSGGRDSGVRSDLLELASRRAVLSAPLCLAESILAFFFFFHP